MLSFPIYAHYFLLFVMQFLSVKKKSLCCRQATVATATTCYSSSTLMPFHRYNICLCIHSYTRSKICVHTHTHIHVQIFTFYKLLHNIFQRSSFLLEKHRIKNIILKIEVYSIVCPVIAQNDQKIECKQMHFQTMFLYLILFSLPYNCTNTSYFITHLRTNTHVHSMKTRNGISKFICCNKMYVMYSLLTKLSDIQ